MEGAEAIKLPIRATARSDPNVFIMILRFLSAETALISAAIEHKAQLNGAECAKSVAFYCGRWNNRAVC
jgi:hypothetical protein